MSRRELAVRLRSVLEGRRVPLWAAALAILVTLPSIGLGLCFDDWWHRIYLLREGRWGGAAKGALDLFVFYDGDPARTHRLVDAGASPWWTDPTLRIAFFRPLSALTHALDDRLWPDAPVLMHGHSIVWYAALVGIAAVLYRRLLPAKLAAGIAAVAFAIDYSHGLPVGWVANRNALITATFGLLALLLHDRARREPSARASKWLAPLALLAGLASGEAAVGAIGYLVAYALFFDGATDVGEGDRARAGPSLGARLATLWPYAPVIAAWATVYRLGGYGVHGSGMYLDPGREPVAYLVAAAAHLPLLLAAELGAPVADFYVVAPDGARKAMIAICVVVLGIAVIAFAPLLRRSRAARFFAAGAFLSVLPPCATEASLRLLLLPSFGLLGLVATLAADLVDRAPWLAAARARRVRAAFGGYLAVGHLVLAPLAIQISERQMSLVDGLVAKLAASVPGDPRARVVISNPPDALLAGYLGLYREVHGRAAPGSLLSLAIGTRPATVTRSDARTLVVRSDGGFYRRTTELLTRSVAAPMPVGARVVLTGVSIMVTHVTADGVPDEASFTFDDPLEAPGLVFLEWRGTRLVPFTLPLVGASARIDAQSIAL